MNCEEYTNLFSGHLDGQNSQAEEQALQAHLDVCPRCRALLNELEQTDRLVAEVPAPPENLTAAIMTKVRVKCAARSRCTVISCPQRRWPPPQFWRWPFSVR